MSKIEWLALVVIVGTTLASWLLLLGAALLGYQVSLDRLVLENKHVHSVLGNVLINFYQQTRSFQ